MTTTDLHCPSASDPSKVHFKVRFSCGHNLPDTASRAKITKKCKTRRAI